MAEGGSEIDNAIGMFQWSFEWMTREYSIWLYPVALSLVSSLVTYVLSNIFFIGMVAPSAFFLPFAAILYLLFSILISLVFTVIIFLLEVIGIKMFIQAYRQEKPSFEEAKNEVQSSVVEYLIVGIIAAIISIFVITVPLAILFIVVSAYGDPSRIEENFSKALDILINRLGEVILLIILVIIFKVALVFIPSLFSIIVSPVSTFIDIMVAGAFTYLFMSTVEKG